MGAEGAHLPSGPLNWHPKSLSFEWLSFLLLPPPPKVAANWRRRRLFAFGAPERGAVGTPNFFIFFYRRRRLREMGAEGAHLPSGPLNWHPKSLSFELLSFLLLPPPPKVVANWRRRRLFAFDAPERGAVGTPNFFIFFYRRRRLREMGAEGKWAPICLRRP